MYSGSLGISTSFGSLYPPGSSGAKSGKPNSRWAGCCWKDLVRQMRSLVSPGLIREMENSSRESSDSREGDLAGLAAAAFAPRVGAGAGLAGVPRATEDLASGLASALAAGRAL